MMKYVENTFESRPTTENFLAMISRTAKPPHSMLPALAVLFTHTEGNHFKIAESDDDELLFSSPVLEILRDRYKRMIDLTESLVEQRFVFNTLKLLHTSGMNWCNLSFTTPSGRLHRTEYQGYVEPEQFIPDEFLADLGKFSQRYS